VLDAFDIDHRARQWERIRAQDREPVLIALDGETVIGFAGAGASRDDPPVAPRELRAMYVRAAWYGTGLADDLMRAAIPGISRSARQGVATAKRPVPGTALATHSLWVFEENPRAQAFYRKYGFELDGTRRAERFSPAVEVRMVRRAG